MRDDLRIAAAGLLARLDTITTEEFSRGGEQAAREYLRAALAGSGATETDLDGTVWPWDVILLERLHGLPEELRAGVCEVTAALYERAYPSGDQPTVTAGLLDLWVNVGLALGGRPTEHAQAAERPDDATLAEWLDEGVCEAVDGCTVELDGHCPHGKASWFLALGLV